MASADDGVATISSTASYLRAGRYRRLRQNEKNPRFNPCSFLVKHGLVIMIFVAFFVGYFLGRAESTPHFLSSISYKLSESFGEAEVSLSHWIGKLAKERILLEDRLVEDYGFFYGRLFDPSMLDKVFQATPDTRAKLKRRLQIKLLTKLVNPLLEVRFVWATAGDSVAAGHGNMFNQSYTAMLEDTVKSSFESIGLRFAGRNYGMSFYQSGVELALCMEAIYGKELDFLTWDFNLHENDKMAHHHIRLWGQRAMTHPSKPALLFMDGGVLERQGMMTEVENTGMPTIVMDKTQLAILHSRVPQTSSETQLPTAVHHLMCENSSIEGCVPCQDPLRYFMCEEVTAEDCLREKFDTLPDCDAGQRSHHPGWKEHLLKGRLIGHYLLTLLEEAIIDLDAIKYADGSGGPVNNHVLLATLNSDEAAENALIDSSPQPPDYGIGDPITVRELGVPNLFRAPSICHTALLPAESRYLGYVTMSDKIGDSNGGYDKGTNKIQAFGKEVDSSHGPMGKLSSPLLVYEMGDRYRCASPKIDHKDYFLIRLSDGWLTMMVPTASEIAAYERPHVPKQGIIFVCLSICPYGHCAGDYAVVSNERRETWVEFEVDGQPVKQVLDFDGCHILENKQGIRWGPRPHGQYQLSTRIVTKTKGMESMLRISSVIVL